MSFFSFSKSYQGIADVFLRDPERYRPLLELLEGLMVAPSELTKIQREVVASTVSAANGCSFCVAAHKATLEALGAEPALIATVDSPLESMAVDDRFRALLRFVAKLNGTPSELRHSDVKQVLSSGWSEQALEDAINVAGVFSYVNRLVDAFGVEGSPRYFGRIGAALAKNGYAALLPVPKEAAARGAA